MKPFLPFLSAFLLFAFTSCIDTDDTIVSSWKTEDEAYALFFESNGDWELKKTDFNSTVLEGFYSGDPADSPSVSLIVKEIYSRDTYPPLKAEASITGDKLTIAFPEEPLKELELPEKFTRIIG